MVENVKVSVIIPVYNAEKFLREAISSIQKQTLKSIEFVFVNDGSTDSSSKILEEYSSIDNIRIITQENKGQGEARNAGIDVARGEYIAFLDADDFVDEDFYEKLYNEAKLTNSDVVCSSTIIYKQGKYIKDNFINKKTILASRSKDFYKQAFYMIRSAVVWNKIYKKEFLLNNKIFFPEVRMFEDNYFSFLLFLHHPSVEYVLDANLYYRKYGNSFMDNINKDNKKYREMIRVSDGLSSKMRAHKFLNEQDKKNFEDLFEEFQLSIFSSWYRKVEDFEFFSDVFKRIKYINIFNGYIGLKQKLVFFKFYVKKIFEQARREERSLK